MADLAAALRRHERIAVDTPIFIYHFAGTTHLAGLAGMALDEFAGGTFSGVTSVLTLMEIAVKLGHGTPADRRQQRAVLGRRHPVCPPQPQRITIVCDASHACSLAAPVIAHASARDHDIETVALQQLGGVSNPPKKIEGSSRFSA